MLLTMPSAFREWSEQARRVRARYFSDVAFVHINKTGGSSIEAALKLPFQHKTALELRDELGEARWQRRFSFAFVRNPWDKVASHYLYRVLTNQTGLQSNGLSFNEWVRLAYAERDARYHDHSRMFMPQLDWVTDEAGKIIVNMIGRYENLEADFAQVCAVTGRRVTLPHLKKSTNGDYRLLYESATVDIVGQLFEKDILAFGYRFE